MRRRIASVALMAGLMFGATFATSPVLAKQTEQCKNNGGNEPSGQQGKCNGKGLTCTVVNPADKAPPGQQPC